MGRFGEKGNMKIVNASGHPIRQIGIEVVLEVSVPNVDMLSRASVEFLAEEIALACAPHVLEGYAIALPGSSVLAAHVLSVLHGLAGYWPKIAWSARSTEGVFLWSEDQQTDLHTLRNKYREKR
jgi:hypothetical protein